MKKDKEVVESGIKNFEERQMQWISRFRETKWMRININNYNFFNKQYEYKTPLE